MYDAIIIGGGPAGLQAALTLGRIHRSVLVVDSGSYRNAPTEHLHNLIGFDGAPPADLRAAARRDLAGYATVEYAGGTVAEVRGDAGAFEVVFADGQSESTRAVVLATGVTDELADIPGLAEQWGRRVAHCPFCHGHEFAGRRIGILASDPARLAHLGGLLRPISSDLVPVDGVERIDEHGDGLRLTLADGSTVDVDGLFASSTVRASPLVAALGLEVGASGGVLIDPMGRTSRPGVYAAGDTAHLRELPGAMQSIAAAIAAGMMAGATVAADALAHT
ncbi:NAD(P)/FAD-dependent oxidoreductase [Pseudolysinimonas sp.]|uniref:NAD(P)/FAD-dependent oxidoreductase n=1 Tax=Pseudolysinimonas sp. TaxID=2680009 RepID=UPI0037847E34